MYELDKFLHLTDFFFFFKSDIKAADPSWYMQLVTNLNEESRKDLDEIYRLADQKRAAAGMDVFNF